MMQGRDIDANAILEACFPHQALAVMVSLYAGQKGN